MMPELPLADADPASLGLAPDRLALLDALIRRHIEDGRYPGAQIAVARHGQLALFRSYGAAREGVAARDDTLWLLFSNTKVLTMAAVWSLVEDGVLSFNDRVADHLPAFAARGKADITLFQVATHQAGFPNAGVSRESWSDHERMRSEVCDFSLEWTPGSRLHYHGASAHLTMAMVIEAVTGEDFRHVIRDRILTPLGVAGEAFVGVPAEAQDRCADMDAEGRETNSAAYRAAGLPGSGGYATARAMAAFYQMLLGGGRIGNRRILSPRMVAFATRDFTGERPDEGMAGVRMHRGLGPHVRGLGENIRGLGGMAAPRTFGHGGVGSSYCWADPDSGVSFAYLTNRLIPDPWHSARLDRISNIVHSAIEPD
jgi:CubicO group peptidase (beta-lactamase class C family)